VLTDWTGQEGVDVEPDRGRSAPEEPGPVIAGRKITADAALRRVMLFARGLAFVFLVFFLPEVARGLAGMRWPGADVGRTLAGTAGAPGLSVLLTAAAVALAAAIVVLHGRLGDGSPGGRRQPSLLRRDARARRDLGVGGLAGVAAASLAALPLLATGAVHVRGWAAPRPGWALVILATLVLKAAHEEMGFRGPAYRDLGGAIGTPLAAAFLAGSFAIVHAGNPEFGRVALLGIFVAGLALAGFVRARGDLALAIGAHVGWNVGLGMLWSLPVSGYRLPGRLLEIELSSDPARVRWSGGAFGPEGGLCGVAALFVLGLFAWRLRSPGDGDGPVGAPGAGGEAGAGPGS
jgi:hypothetical protein